MTREDWAAFDSVAHKPDVKLAMRARCEEQGHDWESGASFMPLRVFQICKWCNKRQ